MKEQLKTEQIFEKLTVPCEKTEMKELEESLLSQGCLNPIFTWNGVILDGHKRYRICLLEGIPFDVTEMQFPSVEDAVQWVCRKRTLHLVRSRLIYKYLVGKWYTAGIIINRRRYSGFPAGLINTSYDTEGRKYSTSREIARELGHNHATIEKFKRTATALDIISGKDPVLFDLLMRGEYKATYEKIMELSKRSQRNLQEERRRFQRETWHKFYMEKPAPEQKEVAADKSHVEEIPIVVGIKDMPEFDPDMELRGLALTIPTWMNAMSRAWSKTDITLVSDLLKRQLAVTLGQFRQQIDQMTEVLTNDP